MRRREELESILLTAYAAVPLYFNAAIGPAALLMFHGMLLLIALQILWKGDRPQIHPSVARAIAVAYLLFFFIDGAVLSRRLIKSSTHLVFFIAVFLVLDEPWRKNFGKRLLVTLLIFVAAAATSTHLSIVVFVIGFAFLAFRQMMRASRAETVAIVPSSAEDRPSSRTASWYVAWSLGIAALMFPLLPRIANPAVRGLTGGLSGATTGFSDTIDFSRTREIAPTGDVVARIWMSQEAIPFFTPLRLRGAVYDAYSGGVWKARRVLASSHQVPARNGVFRLARRSGFAGTAKVQQQMFESAKLFLPVGTYAIAGPPFLLEGPSRGVYRVAGGLRGMTAYDAAMSRETVPLQVESPERIDYPVTPEVEAFARRITGNASTPGAAAAKIESYLSTRFTYIPDPAMLGRPISVEDFLLRIRRGHCEYFAAGMVVLLTSLDIPARVVGGFYGGELNPLTGYFVVHQRDAHAWVEVWEGDRWTTFDPTPASLRPGNTSAGLLRAYLGAVADSMTFFWDRYILTFGLADQVTLISNAVENARNAARSLGRGVSLSALRRIPPRNLMLLGLAMLLGALAARLSSRRRVTMFSRFAGQLARLGIEVDASMTTGEILERTGRERPDLAGAVAKIVELYIAERFSGRDPSPELRGAARAAMQELRAAR